MPGPRLSVKKKIMGRLATRRLQTDDIWEYAVSRSWFQNWEKDVPEPEETEMSQSTNTFSFISGVEFDSQSDNKAIEPLTMSESDALNVFLPESQWRLYTSWFGIDPKHQLRRRPIYGLYSCLDKAMLPHSEYVVLDKELDFIPIWVSRLDDLLDGQRQHILHVFVGENMGYIRKQAEVILGIKKRKSRLWFQIQEDSADIVIEPIFDEKQTLVRKIIEYIPSVRNLMKVRQCQVSRNSYLQEGNPDAQVRQPLAQVWFGDRILSITVGIEEIGFDTGAISNLGEDDTAADDEDLESIVALAPIKNEWDAVLATYVDSYTDNMKERTGKLQKELVNAAREIVGEKLDELGDIRSDYERRFAALAQKETEVSIKEKKLKEENEDLQNRLRTFRKGVEDFQREKQKWEEDVKIIQDQNKIAGSRVVLNVGGFFFTTSVSTLKREQDSVLTAIVSGSESLSRDSDGSVFIDRDGMNFRYILNYLRDGDVAIEALPAELKLLRELKNEAKYYKLTIFEGKLQEKIDATVEGPRSLTEQFVSV